MKIQDRSQNSSPFSRLSKLGWLSVVNIAFALFLWPIAIVSIVYVVVAVVRIRRSGAIFCKDARTELSGIIVMNSIALLIVAGILTLSIGLLRQSFRVGRSNLAVASLENIYHQEIVFRQTNLRFGSLLELRQFGVIDDALASGESASGYMIQLLSISDNSYCVQAKRIDDHSGVGDFLLCENGELRGQLSSAASPLHRGIGTVIRRLYPEADCPTR